MWVGYELTPRLGNAILGGEKLQVTDAFIQELIFWKQTQITRKSTPHI